MFQAPKGLMLEKLVTVIAGDATSAVPPIVFDVVVYPRVMIAVVAHDWPEDNTSHPAHNELRGAAHLEEKRRNVRLHIVTGRADHEGLRARVLAAAAA